VAAACAWSVALVGLEGRIVEVEADIGAGLPRTVLVGLPDSALYQARDRCKAAVSNSGQEWPISLLTINLSPATLPKAGSHYDPRDRGCGARGTGGLSSRGNPPNRAAG
jgi:magnesium chelatase family protein